MKLISHSSRRRIISEIPLHHKREGDRLNLVSNFLASNSWFLILIESSPHARMAELFMIVSLAVMLDCKMPRATTTPYV